MKYFITGVTGFVGKHLALEMKRVDKEIEIIGLIRKAKDLNFFKKLNIKLLIGNLNDKKLLIEGLKNVNSVIHLAALVSGKDKKLFYKTNVLGTKNLVEACLSAGVKNIIFISSRLADSTYGKNVYGQTKLEAEEIIKKSGLNFIILRPALIYGENDKDLTRIIKIIKRFPLIPILGDGNYYLQPVYVKDIVNTIIFILKNNIFNKKTYNLAGEPISYNEIVNQICKRLNKKVTKIHLSPKLIKPLIWIYEKISPNPSITTSQINSFVRAKILDINEAKKDLNFNPISLKDNDLFIWNTKK